MNRLQPYHIDPAHCWEWEKRNGWRSRCVSLRRKRKRQVTPRSSREMCRRIKCTPFPPSTLAEWASMPSVQRASQSVDEAHSSSRIHWASIIDQRVPTRLDKNPPWSFPFNFPSFWLSGIFDFGMERKYIKKKSFEYIYVYKLRLVCVCNNMYLYWCIPIFKSLFYHSFLLVGTTAGRLRFAAQFRIENWRMRRLRRRRIDLRRSPQQEQRGASLPMGI